MPPNKQITVADFFEAAREELQMTLIDGERHLRRVIREPTVNRPGLALAGCVRFFAWRRVQVFGSAEVYYLHSLSPAEREARARRLFEFRIPCAVFCRNLRPEPYFKELALRAGAPLFRSPMITMRFINQATILLEEMFAPEQLIMGSMVDIMGIGVLIQGESGIGKSECVLELIERGYSLVSDDVTRIRLSEERKLIGSSPEPSFGMMEVRGLGILDVRALFGVRSVRSRKQVDLVVRLVQGAELDEVDRLGMETRHVEIMGVKLPLVVIPVRPGRDIARLVEVAAYDAKLRLSTGRNPAQELDQRVIASMQKTKKSPRRPSRRPRRRS